MTLSHHDPHVATTSHGQADALQLRVYTSWDDLAGLSAAWDQLLQNSVGPTIFSTLEWLGAWWIAYGQDKQLVTLAFSDSNGELVGIAPFYRERIRGGIRRLRLVGDGTWNSDNLDLIFRSGQEEACSQALLEWLASESLWDLCELNTLPGNSPTIGPLLSGLEKQRWIHMSYQRPNSAIILPESWEAYLGRLTTEHARGIERYTRRLHRHYAVRIVRCTTEEELPAYLDILFDLHQRRWNSRGEPGAFALPNRRQFYLEMSRAFLRRGWLEFWLVELDAKIVAAQIAFRYGDTIYQLQEGLDPAYYSDRVGQVLRAHIIRQMITDGVRRYDYLGGDEAHKQTWGAQVGSYTDIHFVARSFSRAHISLYVRDGADAGKRWLRMNVPSVYWRLRHAYAKYTMHGDANMP